jgi:hypothetical protein
MNQNAIPAVRLLQLRRSELVAGHPAVRTTEASLSIPALLGGLAESILKAASRAGIGQLLAVQGDSHGSGGDDERLDDECPENECQDEGDHD